MSIPMDRRRSRRPSLLLLILLGGWVAGPAGAGTLVGAGTLDNPNDLTIILPSVGDGLEFLDLSVTDGSTVAAAVAAYSPRGFHWANGAEVSELFDAFGIPYSVTFDNATNLGLGTNSTEATNFISFLGTTNPNAAVGWIDDLTTATHHTSACISVASGCNPPSFTNSSTFGWPSNTSAGVYLVRVVPEPGTLLLLGLGVVALAAAGRRRSLH